MRAACPPFAALLLLAGCERVPDFARAAPAAPRADPLAFFAGESRGEGRLSILFKAPKPFRVASRGRMTGNMLVLGQAIAIGAEPLRRRQWRLAPTGPGRYAGTLTDADGPVTVMTRGALVTIAYRTRNGLDARQWLVLTPDGEAARNHLAFSRFGLVVATIDETIRRSPPAAVAARARF